MNGVLPYQILYYYYYYYNTAIHSDNKMTRTHLPLALSNVDPSPSSECSQASSSKEMKCCHPPRARREASTSSSDLMHL